MNVKILSRYEDTRTNKEDFALTPFLFGVYMNGKIIKVYGIGICWGWWAVNVSLGFNIPKNKRVYERHTRK